jgi:hypothetical protein
MAQGEQDSLLGGESTESPLELVPIGDVQEVVVGGRDIDRQGAKVRDATAIAHRLREAGTDDESMEPRVESVRIAEPWKVAPGDHERFLQGILGPIDVAKDPLGERVEAVATAADQVGIRLPVTVPCRLDEISIHRLRPSLAPSGGAVRALWAAARGVRSIFRGCLRSTGRLSPVTAPRGSGIADAARSLLRRFPWRLLLPSAVIVIAAALTPASELHSNQGDVGLYLEKARSLAYGLVPYRDFAFEYPPLALVAMVVPYLLWPFGRLAVEGYAWLFVAWEAALMLVLAIVLARVVRLGGTSDARAADDPGRVSSMANRLVLVSIGAALAIAFRFDLFPALLVMIALWLTLERRPVAAGVAVGFGVLAKLYPLAVVPALAIPWLVPVDAGRLGRYGVAIVASIAVVLLPFVALAGTDAFAFLSYQAERGLQVESIGGGLALLVGLVNGHVVDMSFGFSAVQVEGSVADLWLAALPAATVVGFGLLAWLGWRRIRAESEGGGPVSAATVVALTFASVLVLLATSKVFSIQYVVWMVSFAALLRGGKFWLAAAVVALTMPIHPLLYGELVKQQALPILVLNLRNALFVALTAWVLWDLAARPSSAAPRPISTGSG